MRPWTAHFSYIFTEEMPLLVGEWLGCSVALKLPWMIGVSTEQCYLKLSGTLDN